MHKIILGLVLAAALASPTQAHAQTTTPDTSILTAFSSDCNYMSKAGYLRFRHFVTTGEWLTYERAESLVSASE